MSKKAILCVDDEKIILDSLKAQLRRKLGNQFKFFFAESASEGMELITELIADKIQIEIVISDWLMPDMKGDEFLHWVNATSPETTKILLTGHVDNEKVKISHCNDEENITCIYKPWNEEELLSMIRARIK